jgi:hypothetical protein
MRRIFVLPVLMAATLSVSAQTKKPVAKTAAKPAGTASKPLKTTNDSLSYAFGISLVSICKAKALATSTTLY